jgi:hypothetical protein
MDHPQEAMITPVKKERGLSFFFTGRRFGSCPVNVYSVTITFDGAVVEECPVPGR